MQTTEIELYPEEQNRIISTLTARLEAELAHAVHELADLTAESPRLHGGGDVVRPVRRGGEAGGVALEQLGDDRVLLGAGEQPGGDLQMPQRSRDAGAAQQVERVGGPGPHGSDGAGASIFGGSVKKEIY